ncbi:hypothetical protein J7438_02450 [Thalassotalea sp. G20_0]|uniref:hypothetical protein n=1 Tax=Thalassotalea sp. G20_0 TaxID=2821093 RepID=UPI001ADC69BC|nr:hypothetical protein [Thalassotalea sp. G20_0]MBO9492953.1 hypothetical protein [Thalassotalea sp. G20_0]
MPAPLVWGLILTGGALLGKVVYDVVRDEDDDDDWEYREAEARRERERAAEQARKAEQERLARERQQRLSQFAEQQLNSLTNQYKLGHRIDKPLVEQALSNRSGCKAKLLWMYDKCHGNNSESDRGRQAIHKLQQLCVQLEG